MRIHVDTDFGGDTDDACALAMVLGWPDTEVVAVSTVADPEGVRAGYARHFLDLIGRSDVPVYAGAGTSLTTGAEMGGVPDHEIYWGVPVEARPGPVDDAVAALARSIELGATVVAIGPYTNLALLEQTQPGLLRTASVVVMGGWTGPPAPGLPAWDAGMDWNLQCDTTAALTVWAEVTDLTLATLTITLGVHVRASHLGRLAGSGPLGELLARQARAHAAEFDMPALGRNHPGLPDDLQNFQYDPLACAVALGWPGATVEQRRLSAVMEGGVLRFDESADGRLVGVVTAIDADAFAERWLGAVEAAQRR